MNNQIAIWLGGALVVAILLDLVLNSGDALLFLARKGLGMINYLAFWR